MLQTFTLVLTSSFRAQRLFLCLLLLVVGAQSLKAQGVAASNNVQDKALLEKFGKATQPLLFMENRGQITDQHGTPQSDVLFMARSNGFKVQVKASGLSYQFDKVEGVTTLHERGTLNPTEKTAETNGRVETYRLDVQLVGANPNPKVIRQDKNPYTESFYNLTHAPDGIVGVPAYEKITLKDVYPGIDWVIYTHRAAMKYDFIVHPGADPDQIKLTYGGEQTIRLQPDGSLKVTTPLGEITEQAPVCFSGKKEVASRFVLRGDILAFNIPDYDTKQTLIIDPTLLWGTYYGGTGGDFNAGNIDVDASGNVYMTGATFSSTNIATSGTHQSVLTTSGAGTDAFLVKFNSAGVRQWATYYGGGGEEFVAAVAVNTSGDIYLTGKTNGLNGVATAGAHQPNYSGSTFCAFLVKFNAAGVRQWGTYYGGTNTTTASSVATDASGNVFICGETQSPSAIATDGGHQPTVGGADNPFLAKFNGAGARQWGTYYGEGRGFGYGVATDASGNVYLTGRTLSTTGIATTGAHQTSLSGIADAFLVKFNTSGVRQWGTYYGGTLNDSGSKVATNASGDIYMVGHTSSSDAIATAGTQQTTFNNDVDVYLAKFTSAGVRQWGTYYGTDSQEYSYAIAVDNLDNVHIAGTILRGIMTLPPTGFATPGAHQETFGGGDRDGFLATFNSLGMRLWGTYYGGDDLDYSAGVAVDISGNMYMAGETRSTTNMTTAGSHQATFGGGLSDLFLAKFSTTTALTATITAQTNVSCFGGSDGSVTVAGSGGTAPYEYSLDGGAFGPSDTFSGLAAGNYTITVQDATLATVDVPVTVLTIYNGSGTFSTENVIDGAATWVLDVYALDLDGDGDIDVLSASNNDDTVAWHENDGSQNFTKRVISNTTDGARSVFALDVDGDGDIDVLSASFNDDTIAWYENDGSQNFTKRVITNTANGAGTVYALDLDGDGDIDVLSASSFDDTIAWYENDGSQNFTKRVVSNTADGARSVFALDVDGDGDIDVLSASGIDDTIAWYENDGSQIFTKRVITNTADGAQDVYATDLDGDGDIDILSASQTDNTIAWYENNGSQSFTQNVITNTANSAYAVHTNDIDGDGDIDVVGAAYADNTIAWYENDGSQNFTQNVITNTAGGPASVYATDMDGDGDIDILNASNTANTVAWYEQTGSAVLCLSSTVTAQTNVSCPGGSDGSVTVAGSGGTAPYQYSLNAGAFGPSDTFSGLAAGNYTITVQDATSATSDVNVTISDAPPITNGQNASDLIGQYTTTAGFENNWTQGTINNNNGSAYDLGYRNPTGIVIDEINHRMFVAEVNNHRILVYDLDVNNQLIDKTPDFVLGQPNFTSNTPATTQSGLSTPAELVYDAANQRLFVSDFTNHRVLVFDVTTITNGENAINVLGQPDFTSNTPATTQSALNSPVGITYDAANQRLFVSEMLNHRVTVFDLTTITNGENAINVLGQPDFTTGTIGTTQSKMRQPHHIVLDPNNQRLFVTERLNHRVVVFDVASITDGENAINVLGQPDFTTDTPATTQAGMNEPKSIAFDNNSQRLFVGEGINNRILIFDVATITDGENAINVLGQPDFTTNTAATTQAGMTNPAGLFYDTGNATLYVTDRANNRIMVFGFGLAVSGTVTDNTDCPTPNGAIDITTTGGTAPYTYAWADIYSTEDRTDLTAGNYTVTVTDACGTAVVKNFTVGGFGRIAANLTSRINVSCFGGNNGSISVVGSDGALPYTYSINGGSFGSSGTFSGLTAGNYLIRVRDNNGCQTQTLVSIDEPASALGLLSLVDPPSCTVDGSISPFVSGGTAPYTYNWADLSGNSNVKDRSGLQPGNYSVTVTDANGCTFSSGPITVDAFPGTCGEVVCLNSTSETFSVEPDPANVSYTWTVPTGATITSGQGTPEIQVDWTAVAPGSYQVCVVAVNDCNNSTQTCMDVEYFEPSSFAGLADPACEGSEIDLFASGGVS